MPTEERPYNRLAFPKTTFTAVSEQVDTDLRHLSADMLRFNSMMLASGQLAAAQNEPHKPATICRFRLKQNDSSNQEGEVPTITPELLYGEKLTRRQLS